MRFFLKVLPTKLSDMVQKNEHKQTTYLECPHIAFILLTHRHEIGELFSGLIYYVPLPAHLHLWVLFLCVLLSCKNPECCQGRIIGQAHIPIIHIIILLFNTENQKLVSYYSSHMSVDLYPVQPAVGDPASAGGLDWVTHRGPFQPLPFCDSVILLQ